MNQFKKFNHHDWKKIIFSELAIYAKAESIKYTVLNGYDPITEKIGRDLDVHIPSSFDATRMLSHFRKLLKLHGIKWIMVMNPIWGMRCIGVRDDFDYIEFHIFNNLYVTVLPVSKLYKLKAEEQGEVKLLIDPLYMLFKYVLIKRNRDIFKLKPIWNSDKPHQFLIDKKDEISKRLGNTFSSLLYRNDLNLNERKILRKYFLKFLLNAFASPISTITQFCRSIYINKLKYLYSPCTPKFIIYTSDTSDIANLEINLREKLSKVFKNVYLDYNNKKHFSKKAVKYIQSTQTIYILVSEPEDKKANFVKDYEEILLEPSISREAEISNISKFILKKTMFFNSKWSNKLTRDIKKIENRR